MWCLICVKLIVISLKYILFFLFSSVVLQWLVFVTGIFLDEIDRASIQVKRKNQKFSYVVLV